MSALSLSIGADTTDLNTKLALAQAEVRNFNKEVKNLADEMQDAGAEAQASLLPQLQAAAAEAATAKAEVASLKAELAEMSGAAEHAGGAFISMREGVEGLNARITETTSLFSGLGELFLVGFAGEKLLSLGEAAEEFGDKLKKASEETGITVENLSALNVAADHADVEFDTLQRGLAKFALAIQAGVEGTGNQAKAFAALGISQEELKEKGNDSAEVLELVAQKLDQFGDGANKQAIVLSLLGAKLHDMQPILTDLAEDGFEGLRAKADQVGLLLGDEFAEDMKKAHDATKDFDEASKSLGMTLGAGFESGLAEFMRELVSINSQAARDAQALRSLETQAKEIQALIDAAPAEREKYGAIGNFFFGHDPEELKKQLAVLKTDIENIKALGPISIDHETKDKTYKPDAPDLADADAEKKAAKDTYDYNLKLLQAQAESFKSYSAERIAILRQEKDLAVQIYGASSDQAIEAQGRINAAVREAGDAAVAANQKLADSYNRLTTESARLTQEIKNGVNERVAEERKFDEAIDRSARNMATKFTEANTHIQTSIDELAAQNNKIWDQMGQHMESGFNSAIVGMITKGTTLQQAMQKIAQQMVGDLLNAGLKMAEDWAVSQAKQLLSTQTTEALKTAAANEGVLARVAAWLFGDTAGKASETAAAGGQVLSDAAVAAAGAYAATAAIPVVGPGLAPAAAASAYTAVMGFLPEAAAYGGFDVPTGVNPVTQLHQEEMVLPASIANPLRDILGGDGMGSGGGGGQTYTDNSTYNITVGGAGTSMLNGIVTAVGSLHKHQAQRLALTLSNATR